MIRQARQNWWICLLMWQIGCVEVLWPGENILAERKFANFAF